MILKDLSQTFLAEICKGLTVSSFKFYNDGMRDVVALLGQRDPVTLTAQDVRDWIEHELTVNQLKPKTTKARLQVFARYVRWLIDRKLVPAEKEDIFNKRGLPRLTIVNPPKHAITEAEHTTILDECRKGKAKPWWMTACLIGWHTGLRLSDVAQSQWTNVDWTQKVYNESPQKTRRLGKRVSIPLDPELMDWLFALRERPYYESKFIIPDMAGYYGGESDGCLSRMFRDLTTKARVNPLVTFHSYRHAFVSRLLNAGIEPIVIASMTGQTVKQIEEYAHISIGAKQEALQKAREFMQRQPI